MDLAGKEQQSIKHNYVPSDLVFLFGNPTGIKASLQGIHNDWDYDF